MAVTPNEKKIQTEPVSTRSRSGVGPAPPPVWTRSRSGVRTPPKQDAWEQMKLIVTTFLEAVRDIRLYTEDQFKNETIENLKTMVVPFFSMVETAGSIKILIEQFFKNDKNIIGRFIQAYVGLAQFGIVFSRFKDATSVYTDIEEKHSAICDMSQKAATTEHFARSKDDILNWKYTHKLLNHAQNILTAAKQRSAVLVFDCKEPEGKNKTLSTIDCRGIALERVEIIPRRLIPDEAFLTHQKNTTEDLFLTFRSRTKQAVEEEIKKENISNFKILSAVGTTQPTPVHPTTEQEILLDEVISRFSGVFPSEILKEYYRNATGKQLPVGTIIELTQKWKLSDIIESKDIEIFDLIAHEFVDMQVILTDENYKDSVIFFTSPKQAFLYTRKYLITSGKNNANWIYECIGRNLNDGTRGISCKDVNEYYIKLPGPAFHFWVEAKSYELIENEQFNFFSVDRVLTDEDKTKELSHTVSWANCFGIPNHVGAAHCQKGSNQSAYKITPMVLEGAR